MFSATVFHTTVPYFSHQFCLFLTICSPPRISKFFEKSITDTIDNQTRQKWIIYSMLGNTPLTEHTITSTYVMLLLIIVLLVNID